MYATIEDFVRTNDIPYTQILIAEIQESDGLKKVPVYEQNNLTPQEIQQRNLTKQMTLKNGVSIEMRARPDSYMYKGKSVRTKSTDTFNLAHSLYLKHTPDVYCIDIDDPNVRSMRDFYDICDPELRPHLTDCLYIKGNTKGIHIYARILNVPEYSDQIGVFKSFRGDLIHRTNMWEKVEKFVYRGLSDEPLKYGDSLCVSVLQFEDVRGIFNEKLNKTKQDRPRASEPTDMSGGSLSLADCVNECQLFIYIGCEYHIFAKMCGYTTWRNIAFICASECGHIGRDLFRLVSSQYEPEKYDEMNVYKFYEGVQKTTPTKPLTVATLKKLYKKTDEKTYKTICEKVRQVQLKDEYEPPKHERFDGAYFHTLTTYARQKKYFETFCAKILRPECVYVYCEVDGDEITPCMYRDSALRDTFAHLVCADDDDSGDAQFIKRWIRDPEIRMFHTLDFIPYRHGAADTIDHTVYNTFTGFSRAAVYLPEDEARAGVSRWLDILYQICGAEIAAFEYMLALFAHILQCPAEKPGGGVCVVLKGRQGVGKNMILNAFAAVLGPSLYYASADVLDFFGPHANAMFRRLVCVYNEAELRETFDIEGRVKAAITEPHATLNEKYQKAIKVRNFARFFITTNKPNAVKIDVKSGDRRFFVVEATDHYLGKQYGADFWEETATIFNSPKHAAALFTYLMSYDISRVDWKRRPLTTAYKKMCMQFIPVEALFLESIATKSQSCTAYMRTSRELYTEWELFCSDHGFNGRFKNIQQLAASIADLDVPIQKKRGVEWSYVLDLAAAVQILRAKGLILE